MGLRDSESALRGILLIFAVIFTFGYIQLTTAPSAPRTVLVSPKYFIQVSTRRLAKASNSSIPNDPKNHLFHVESSSNSSQARQLYNLPPGLLADSENSSSISPSSKNISASISSPPQAPSIQSLPPGQILSESDQRKLVKEISDLPPGILADSTNPQASNPINSLPPNIISSRPKQIIAIQNLPPGSLSEESPSNNHPEGHVKLQEIESLPPGLMHNGENLSIQVVQPSLSGLNAHNLLEALQKDLLLTDDSSNATKVIQSSLSLSQYFEDDLSPDCAQVLASISHHVSQFLECAIESAVPSFKLCRLCVSHYLKFEQHLSDLSNESEAVNSTCYRKILSYDHHGLIGTHTGRVRSLWEHSHCQSCFNVKEDKRPKEYALKPDVINLFKSIEGLANCTGQMLTLGQNGTLCEMCQVFHDQVQNDYLPLKSNRNYVCLDVQDTVDRIREDWDNRLQCFVPEPFHYSLLAAGLALIFIPFIVYVAMRIIYRPKEPTLIRRKSLWSTLSIQSSALMHNNNNNADDDAFDDDSTQEQRPILRSGLHSKDRGVHFDNPASRRSSTSSHKASTNEHNLVNYGASSSTILKPSTSKTLPINI